MPIIPLCVKCNGRSILCAECDRRPSQTRPPRDATLGLAAGAACPAGCGGVLLKEVATAAGRRLRYARCPRCPWSTRPEDTHRCTDLTGPRPR